MIEDNETAIAGQRAVIERELPIEDRPVCPACSAGAAHQRTVLRAPDGALEIVILVCTNCATDHPAWF